MTDKEKWDKFYEEESTNVNRINKLSKEGHTHHCACRIVWGDGICTCLKGVEGEKKNVQS
jgi:hypothetical protein